MVKRLLSHHLKDAEINAGHKKIPMSNSWGSHLSMNDQRIRVTVPFLEITFPS